MLRTIHLYFVTKNNWLLTRICRENKSANFSTLISYGKRRNNNLPKDGCPTLSRWSSPLPRSARRVASTYLEKNYSKSVIEDASLDFIGLACKYNYPVESHTVQTTDGYILKIHRMPRPQGKPVFLMHGLCDSSDTWILPGVDIGLGYYLHDLGYDVWLGNARGNFYSRKHITRDPEGKTFWDFSWHEIGYYDLPAMIDYALEKTCEKQLTYIGHSQGTTTFFVMASARPEYNAKIRLMNALAPVAYMTHASLPFEFVLRTLVRYMKDVAFEFMPRTDKFMFKSKFMEIFFIKSLMAYLGRYKDMWESSRIAAYPGHMPSGASFKQIKHYAQIKDLKRFCQYDYGKKLNMLRYGSEEPPLYPLEEITCPLALYYAQNDPLSRWRDVHTLISQLPNIVDNQMYSNKEWNHVAMIWSVGARQLAHKHIVEVMQKYN